MTNTHIQTQVQGKGQSVQKIEWKQMDGQTDSNDCFTFTAIMVSN